MCICGRASGADNKTDKEEAYAGPPQLFQQVLNRQEVERGTEESRLARERRAGVHRRRCEGSAVDPASRSQSLAKSPAAG